MNESPIAIAKAVIIALMTATVLLVTIVLPAEYGIDWLRTGKLTGLISLAEQPTGANEASQAMLEHDAVQFVLAAYESVEYKYSMQQHETLVYRWEATAPIAFDFHGEPNDGPEGFAERYAAGTDSAAAGTFTAPFHGIHGWYFENRTFSDVTVTLDSAGFYSDSLTFRDGYITQKRLAPDLQATSK